MKQKRRIVGISIVVGVIALAAIFFIMSGSGNRKIKSHLSLGNKYLDDLDYEQAFAEYEAVLDLSPNDQTALKGIENVCLRYADSLLIDTKSITIERLENLYVILEDGYQLTENASIQDKVNQVKKVINDKEADRQNEAKEMEPQGEVEKVKTPEEEYEEWQAEIDAEVEKMEGMHFIILEWAFKEQIFKSEWNWVFWSNVNTMTITFTEGKDNYEVEIEGGPSQIEHFVYEINKDTLQGQLVKYFAEDFQGGFINEKVYTDKPNIDFAQYSGEIGDTELLMRYEIVVQDVEGNIIRNKSLWHNDNFSKYKYQWRERDENERIISSYEKCEFTDLDMKGWMLTEYEYTKEGEMKSCHSIKYDSEMNMIGEVN